MELQAARLEDLAPLRRAKVDSLRVRVFSAQHERLAAESRCLRICEGRAEPGYVLFLESSDEEPDIRRRLIEFDVSVPWRGRVNEYLAATVKELGVEQIEVRSDDGAALESVLGHASKHGWGVRPLAAVYALETGMLRRPPRPEGAAVRLVTKGELEEAEALIAGEKTLPPAAQSRDEISAALAEKRLWGLYHGARLVGTAEVLPQDYHRYVDLRPVIHPEFRRSGLATFLIGQVSQELLSTNRRLLTETSPSQRAWRRMAETLGLTLAAHRLLTRPA
jgi:GNAT superfamily N-acetyltransferase